MTNNIVIIDGTAGTTPAGIYAYGTDGSSGTTNMYIYNNSIYVANPGSMNNYGVRFANSASCTLNITVENNVVIGSVTSLNASITYAFNQITFNTGTKQFNNNISSDGTADDFSGSNHQINVTAENIFTDAPNNVFSLTKTSLALNAGKTVASVSSLEKSLGVVGKNNIEVAAKLGKEIATRALKKGVKEVVFDRGGFLYHGKVKALADAARENGLKL